VADAPALGGVWTVDYVEEESRAAVKWMFSEAGARVGGKLNLLLKKERRLGNVGDGATEC
jgi:hypothetical protein